jgi:LuxR family maltose regulon positive regulatory protein
VKPESVARSPEPTVDGPVSLVLRAKLHEPRFRPEWVRRSRLLRDLRFARDAGVVLVEAPAGYGKSTLIAQWKTADPAPFAWVGLDASDNDPVRFWTYTLQAIAGVLPDLGGEISTPIRTTRRLRNLGLPRLLNDLAEIDGRLVVVFDDYHLIRNPAAHLLLNFAIDNLPPTTQFVISTRADPPIRLGKLRLERKIFEVRADDLRFDVDEANVLMRNVIGRRLPQAQIEAIVDRTEGWPAAVYLAAISLWEHDDVPALLDRFSGDSRPVASYLTEEVLQRQPRDVYDFLTRTSILESFTAPLASAVVGASDCAEQLAQLERSNLFVVPLDDRREWYRYHHLFQEFLASELRRAGNEHIQELHRRASEWHRSQGFVGRAVHHSIEAGDIRAARDLIWSNLLTYINEGRFETMDAWFSAIGHEAIASDPVLSLAAGWMNGLTGHLDDVDRYLAAAERGDVEGPLPDGNGTLASSIALLRATYGRDEILALVASARAAATNLSPSSGWHAFAHFTLGFLLYVSGSYEEAQAVLSDAVSSSHEQPLVQAVSLAEHSMLALDMGDPIRARASAQSAVAVQEEHSITDIPQASFVRTAWGRVLAGEGDLSGASVELEGALDLRDSYPQMNPLPTLQTLIALTPIRFALGDQGGARHVLQRALSIIDHHDDVGILEAQAKQLQRTLGGSPQRPALYGETLTDREISVLRLLATPLTHREIGAALFISLNTVKSHARSLHQKLLVKSRAEAVKKGRELGLL